MVHSRWDWSPPTRREVSWVFLLGGFSPVSVLCHVPFAHCASLQSTSTLTVGVPANGPVTLRCFRQATGRDLSTSGPRTAIVKLWRKLRLSPGPILTCMYIQIPGLLKPDLFQGRRACLFGCPVGFEFRKPSAEGELHSLSEVYFVWYDNCYSNFLLISICMAYFFHPLTFMCP